MATPLTDAITALTTYANTVTGASDTTLSDAVGTLAAGYGGGGGGLELLSSFTTSEQTLDMQIDFDPSWANYDFILIDGVIGLTANDWIYFDFNSTSPSSYKGSANKIWIISRGFKESGTWHWLYDANVHGGTAYTGFPTYMYFKTYANTKYIKANQTIRVWGCKYA